MLYEDVRGTVIGPITFPYEFWRDGQRLAKGHFENDEQAVDWFRDNYPEDFRKGAEMRVFDK